MSDPITLTEAEREALICDCQDDPRDDTFCPLHADKPHFAPDLSAEYLLATVERILAARLAEVTAERDEAKASARTAWDVHREHVDAMGVIIARHSGDATFATIRADKAEAENDRLRDTLARVEALATSWYGVHDGLAADLLDTLAGGDS